MNEIKWHFRDAMAVYFEKLEQILEKSQESGHHEINIGYTSQCDN